MTDLAVALRKRGHQVTVLTTVPHFNVEPDARARQPLRRMWGGLLYRSDLGGVEIFHAPVRTKSDRIWMRLLDYVRFHGMSTLAGLLAVRRYDIVFAPSPPLTIGLNAWLLAAARRAPLIYNVQEIYPDVAVQLGIIKPGRTLRLLHTLERFIYRHATAITVIGERFRTALISKGVPSAKIRTIPNFVDSQFEIAPEGAGTSFAALHGVRGRFVVLYAGNIGLTQDLEGLLEAADRLRAIPEILFLVVGDGARKRWLEERVAARGSANVRLLPYQPRSMVPSMYAACDVGLVPLRKGMARDTFPSKAYSIMIAGRPVLAAAETDTELADFIRRTDCGVVVPPEEPMALADAIREMHVRRPPRPRERELEVASEYHAEAAADRYEALIRELTVAR